MLFQIDFLQTFSILHRIEFAAPVDSALETVGVDVLSVSSIGSSSLHLNLISGLIEPAIVLSVSSIGSSSLHL